MLINCKWNLLSRNILCIYLRGGLYILLLYKYVPKKNKEDKRNVSNFLVKYYIKYSVSVNK